MKLNNKGFTLIEVLTVLVIISILGLVVVPNTMDVIKGGKENTYKILVKNIRDSAVNLYKELEYSDSKLYYYDGDKELFFAGSEPTSTSTTTVPVTPDIYIGDIPSQVKDGSFDEEKYTLPYIDYSKILPGLNDYVTELNNLAQQLADNIFGRPIPNQNKI